MHRKEGRNQEVTLGMKTVQSQRVVPKAGSLWESGSEMLWLLANVP